MAYGSTKPLVDKILDGRLNIILREARDRGESFDKISHRFADEYDLSISRELIRKWVAELPSVHGAGDGAEQPQHHDEADHVAPREVDGAVALAHAGHRSATAGA